MRRLDLGDLGWGRGEGVKGGGGGSEVGERVKGESEEDKM